LSCDIIFVTSRIGLGGSGEMGLVAWGVLDARAVRWGEGGGCELAFEAGRRLREFLIREPKAWAALGRGSGGGGEETGDVGAEWAWGWPGTAAWGLLPSGMLSIR
jgi:hypothetical protein